MNRHLCERLLLAGCALPAILALGACGGGGSPVSSTPAPPPIVAPPPPPPAPPPPPPSPPPPSGSFVTAEFQRSNGVVQSGALAAYNAGATGAGVLAAVIDSGVDATSAEFAGRIHPASADLVASRGLQDEGGHGTAVSSVLLGAKNDSGTHGVAFNAQLLVARTDSIGSCANADASESCTHPDSAIARGVDVAVANRARVINISLGGSPANFALRSAISRATAAGIIIVISAGNDGVEDPAAAVNPDLLAQIANESAISRNLVIIAGALDASNTALASFSNKAGNGATHYLGALGSRVRSIDENGTAFLFSGTSFSAPVISGAVALLAQAFPNLTGTQIVDILFRSADDLGAAGIDSEFGVGALNLARAFAPQGATSLAGSAIPVSLTATGTTSAPIGDAAKTGLSAVILDSFGRAYEADVGANLRRAPIAPRLAQGLGIGTRAFSFNNGPVAVSLSVAQAAPRGGADRLLLSGTQTQQARALAGQIVAQLGPKTSVAFGISQSGLALAKDYREQRAYGFLVGRAATRDWGFEANANSGIALSQRISGFDVSLAAETGATRFFANELRLRPQNQGFGYGAVSLGVHRPLGRLSVGAHATMLRERETLLGTKLTPLYGADGATSLFADANISLTLPQNWELRAAWRQGWTRLAAGGARQSTDQLKTSAWSFDVARDALFDARDSLALRIAQPLRVNAGGLNLTLPIGFDYATGTASFGTTHLNLAPDGREVDVEAIYSTPLWGGALSANLFWRTQPGNIAAAPDDQGAALRFTFGL